MTLETGQILNNRYRIVKLLGQGGFGAVYRAWDVNLKGPCAIKENFDVSPAAQNQFAREASILYNLRHQNLPKVTDHFGIPGQGQYLVMEYIEGQDLQEKIDRAGGPLPEEQVLPWMLQVCDALSYLHSRTPPIIHRDIKPANVRITPEGTVYLVDFGIAKLYDPDRKTTLGARAVTPGYSPFEQYGQKPTDTRTDVYALGATLYAALTGKAPLESIERVGGAALFAPHGLNPEISPHLEAVILRAMEFLPDQRYQSVVEFKRALTAPAAAHVSVAQQQPVAAAPTQVLPIAPSYPAPVAPTYAPPMKVASTQQVAPGKVMAREVIKQRQFPWLIPVGLAAVLVLSMVILLVIYSVLKGNLFGVAPTETSVVVISTNTSFVAPTEPPGQAAVMPPTFECTDPLGCADVPSGALITVAYALVVSGPNESLGIDARRGIEMAIDDRGQILGHGIRLIGEDDGCSPEGGRAAGEALASNPSIVAVIGTSCSSAAREAVPLLSQAGFVIVSPSNTAPDLTDPNSPSYHPGYMRTSPNDIVQGVGAARFAREHLRVNRAATIHDGSLYADMLQEIFAEEFRSLGGEIISQERIDPNQTDMGPLLNRIASGNPESETALIYFPIFMPAGGNIIQQARGVQALANVHLMGADGLFSPDVVDVTGEAVEGFLVSSPYVSGVAYDEFVAKYKERFGTDPISIFHAHAYDAAMMIFAAIERVAVQSPDGSLHVPRGALREAMYATRDFPGVTGVLTCNSNGECANPIIAVYQYHTGRYPPERIWP